MDASLLTIAPKKFKISTFVISTQAYHTLCSHGYYKDKSKKNCDFSDEENAYVQAHLSTKGGNKWFLQCVDLSKQDEYEIVYAENDSYSFALWKLSILVDEALGNRLIISKNNSSRFKLIPIETSFYIQEISTQLYLAFDITKLERDSTSNFVFLSRSKSTTWDVAPA